MENYKHKIINTDELTPYINNSRTHSNEQVKQIASSINGEWKFFPLNDCYVADALGNIYSVCTRQKSKSGNLIEKYQTKLLKGSIDKSGYKTYRIVINNKKKHVKGHRIVALSFFGETEKPCVNHIDGNKQNNNIKNLEYVTVAENNLHAIKTGLWDKSMCKPKRKILESDHVTIYLLNKVLKQKREDIAKANNVCRQTVDNIINKLEPILGEFANA